MMISTVDFDFEDEEWTEDEEEYTDNVVKDPDFTIRTTSTLLGRDVETYGVITPGEEVFDHDMQGGEEDDDDNIEFPDEVKVNHSGDIKDEQCFIVYKKNLLQLVTFLLHLPEEMKCREPECTSTVRLGPDPVTKSVGSGMVLKWYCSDGHLLWRWCSQPTFKYGLQGGDFMLSSSLLLSGNNYSKISLMFKFMNLGCVCDSTFRKIQLQYCVPVIDRFWKRQLNALIPEMKRRNSVVLLGDGRMDSPGHSAQYCTYTVMDEKTRAIVALEVVDKRETERKSAIMEKKGFEKAMDSLLEADVPVRGGVH
ncbi:uncharacterized protein LOC115555888 [Gadus morhua]|uniref:uncharacterized protein LOC115555888 n=1 Tax=Gadus morhua TaxID=8049 RepID=UPI0011B39FEB|nr:uncharacterized protein LOC115555888 [Gadus morhua]